MNKIFKAVFDFRHPQERPEEDGTHQYTIDGFVEIPPDKESMILRYEGNYDYNIIGGKTLVGSFGGKDTSGSNARAGWAAISDKNFVGKWAEDNILLLFSISIGKEV